ncbi:MAG: hypothetical protein P8Z37_11380 [Acidobacteriota bacterium]
MANRNDISEERIKEHIREMKDKILSLVGDPQNFFISESSSLQEQERFLEQILFMEELNEEPLFNQLEKEGIQISRPESLNDPELHKKLWEIIHAMARMGHYLSNTDHLSDRELYELLFNDILREPTSVNPDPTSISDHIDILGGCSDEDLKIRLKYYADEDERACWEGDFPEDEVPQKEPLPYDRDRHLPMPQNGFV